MELQDSHSERVKKFVREWDDDHPVDYLWRKHFNIPFGSKEHLDTDFIDQHVWYEESEMIEAYIESRNNPDFDFDSDESVKIKERPDAIKMDQSEIEADFSKLLNDINGK